MDRLGRCHQHRLGFGESPCCFGGKFRTISGEDLVNQARRTIGLRLIGAARSSSVDADPLFAYLRFVFWMLLNGSHNQIGDPIGWYGLRR